MLAKDENLPAGSLKSLSAEDVVKLTTLSIVSRALATSYDVEDGLDSVLFALLSACSAERGLIQLYDAETGAVRMESCLDRSAGRSHAVFAYSNTLMQRCRDEKIPVLTLDAAAQVTSQSAVLKGMRSVMVHPITSKDKLLGVVYLDSLLQANRFQDNELRMLGIVADMVAAFLERAENAEKLLAQSRELEFTLGQLKDVNSLLADSEQETIYKLSLAAEFRDDEGGQHVQRVSHYCEAVARQLGLTPDIAANYRIASQLHDVGKVAIPESILLKPGRYTEYEREVMQQHTLIGAKILAWSSSPIIRLAEEMAMTHHEKWDGTGYPLGLAGDEIPLAGRVVAVADVFDGLTSERRYKSAWSPEKALGFVAQQAGAHFDPDVAQAFLAVSDQILAIRARYPSVATKEKKAPITDKTPGANLAARRPSLLLVEPDDSWRETMLAEAAHRDWTVNAACDYTSAKRVVQTAAPDLVLMEVAHAGADEFLDWLQYTNPSVPIVALSAETDFSRRLEVSRRGVSLYLHKPMAAAQVYDELIERYGREPLHAVRLLVMDDNEETLTQTCFGLRIQGFQVLEVSDPLQFWEQLSEGKPDLLLLDWEMPMVNGPDICNVLRADPRWERLPIVVISENVNEETLQMALAAGADDVVSRRLALPRLALRLRARLSRWPRRNAAAVSSH